MVTYEAYIQAEKMDLDEVFVTLELAAVRKQSEPRERVKKRPNLAPLRENVPAN